MLRSRPRASKRVAGKCSHQVVTLVPASLFQRRSRRTMEMPRQEFAHTKQDGANHHVWWHDQIVQDLSIHQLAKSGIRGALMNSHGIVAITRHVAA